MLLTTFLIYRWRRNKIKRSKTIYKYDNLVLKLIIRSSLNMGKGKIASQVGHAVSGIMEHLFKNKDILKAWKENGQPKIVLKANDEEIFDVEKKAKKAGINTYKVFDAGRTQIKSGSFTVLAIGPAEDETLRLISGNLKLL
ncbi:hypothetical protein GVAV_000959 [Gurleya vavrai]